MRTIRLTLEAELDFDQIVETSALQFGEEAADRYRALFAATLRRLADNPDQRVARTRPYRSDALRFYHLRHTSSVGARGVARPRHFVVYQFDEREVLVVRVLHDAMDLDGQLAD